MKISEMSAKTSIEVNDDDILVIEDTEGTKRITVKEFRTFLMQNDGVENTVKQYFNQGIDKIITALNDAKLTVRTEKKYSVTIVIKNAEHGNADFNYIEFALYDCDNSVSLTKADINNLTVIGINEETEEPILRKFLFEINVTNPKDGSTVSCSSDTYDIIEVPMEIPDARNYTYPVKLYRTDNRDADASENAGIIKVRFDELTGEQNIVSCITANCISIRFPQDENYRYTFVCDESKCNNEVEYKEVLYT